MVKIIIKGRAKERMHWPARLTKRTRSSCDEESPVSVSGNDALRIEIDESGRSTEACQLPVARKDKALESRGREREWLL